MSVQQMTEELLKECRECFHRHSKMREEDAVPDFFSDVKPHVDYYHQLLTDWRKAVEQWIIVNRPKHVRIQQIDAAVEAMNQFLVQSFYKETGKNRFVRSINSVEYTMVTLLRAIEKEGESIDS